MKTENYIFTDFTNWAVTSYILYINEETVITYIPIRNVYVLNLYILNYSYVMNVNTLLNMKEDNITNITNTILTQTLL